MENLMENLIITLFFHFAKDENKLLYTTITYPTFPWIDPFSIFSKPRARIQWEIPKNQGGDEKHIVINSRHLLDLIKATND